MKHQIQLSDHFTYGRLLRFVFPSIVMLIFTSIYSVVDGLFVSNLVGDNALAAINIVWPLAMMVGAFGFMLGSGGSAEIARAMGQGEPERARRYFTSLVLAVIAIGTVLSVLCCLFMEELSRLFGASDLLLEDCVTYGFIMLAGSVPFMLQSCFQSYLLAAERPKLGLWLTVAAGLTNAVLDYVFIGLMDMGVAGAAWATVAGYLVGGIIPLLYFLLPNKSPLRFTRTHAYPRMLMKSCANGSSELMTNISASAVNVLYNIQVMHLAGEAGVAALSIILYVNFVFISAFIGLGMGAAPLFSYHYGRGNTDELKSLFRKCITVLTVLSVTMAVTSQVFNEPLTRLFVDFDQSLVDMTVHGFRIFAVSFLFAGTNIFGSMFFTALGDGLDSALISFLRTLLFQCGAIWLLPRLWGLDGVWVATTAAELMAICVTVSLFLLRRKRYGYL